MKYASVKLGAAKVGYNLRIKTDTFLRSIVLPPLTCCTHMRTVLQAYRSSYAFFVLLIFMVSNASAQRELTVIPVPDPVSEMAAMTISDEAAINLYASDPAIRKPIQMNFDCTGGLWVASSEHYPQIKPGEKANDKIIVLRDTDGDGVHDLSTVFADGLLIPTGVVPDGPHAAYVADSTELVYLRDLDGDGKADERHVVFSGFGTEDTHHLIHTLRWGPDGCLYFNQSIYIHSHLDTAYGTRHLDGGGIWRYRPSTGRLEVFCKGFVNPWGHVFDENGESFATDGAYFEGINYVFPDAVFVTSPGAERWLKGLNPGSPKHCGLEILSGTHIPESWSGDLVTNDFRSHRVCRFSIRPSGSGYQSRQQPEIITTSHVAFRPIDARMGPDGALYIADWYNPIIQHGEVDFRDDRRDRSSGRIWRVSFPGRELDPWPDFQSESIDQMLGYLDDPSLTVRQFARQQLWRHASKSPEAVIAKMENWVSTTSSPTRVLELLWMDEVVGIARADHLAMIDPTTNAAVTRTQMRSAWRNRESVTSGDATVTQKIAELAGLTQHSDPRVRLEAVVMNGQTKTIDAAIHLVKAIKLERDGNLDFAIWQSIRKLKDVWVPASKSGEIDWSGHESALAYAVSAVGSPDAAEIAIMRIDKIGNGEHTDKDNRSRRELMDAIANAGNASHLGRLLDIILSGPRDETFAEQMAPIIARTQRDGIVPKDAATLLDQAVTVGDDLWKHPKWGAALIQAARVWKATELDETFANILPDAPPVLRPKLIDALGSFDTPVAKDAVSKFLTSDDPITRVAAIEATLASRPYLAAAATIELLATSETADAGSDLIVGALQKQGLANVLATLIAKSKLSRDTADLLLRRIRTSGGHEALEAAVRQSGQLGDAAWVLTPELSQKILSRAVSSGSAARGEVIYRRAELQCIRCHAIGNGGGIVGPNLISLGGSSQIDYILESLLDPNAKLKEGYSTVSVLTDDGELINGIAVGASDDYLSLRLADGTVRKVLIDSIEQERPGKSLMPEGLLDQLTEDELADLVAFLSELGRTPAFTVSTAPILRSLETLIFSPEANRILNRTSADAVARGHSEMNWRALTSRVDGTISIDEMDVFQQHETTPPTSFLRFHVVSSANTSSGIELPTDGIECWVDGKPTPVWDLSARKLSEGEHTIVLAIDRSTRTQPFKISLGQVMTAVP